MLYKMKQKIKSGDFYKRPTVHFIVSTVFFILALIQLVLLFFRREYYFYDLLMLILMDVAIAAIFLGMGLSYRKKNLRDDTKEK